MSARRHRIARGRVAVDATMTFMAVDRGRAYIALRQILQATASAPLRRVAKLDGLCDHSGRPPGPDSPVDVASPIWRVEGHHVEEGHHMEEERTLGLRS